MKERYQPSSRFAFRVVAQQGLLVPLRGGVADLASLFTLDEVGTEIWRSLADGLSRDEVVDRLVDRFEVDRERALADLEPFLQLLLDQGMLEQRSGPTVAGAPE